MQRAPDVDDTTVAKKISKSKRAVMRGVKKVNSHGDQEAD